MINAPRTGLPLTYQDTMNPLVPSTQGEVTISLRTRLTVVNIPKHFAKFASVREEVNTLLKEWDDPSNPVFRVEIKYTFPLEVQ